jgi:hypothetical protein
MTRRTFLLLESDTRRNYRQITRRLVSLVKKIDEYNANTILTYKDHPPRTFPQTENWFDVPEG